MIRRLIGFILSVMVAVILFILIISLFPSRKKSVDIINMSYVFIDDDGTEYDIFEPTHGSARDWSFLFKWNKDKSENETENEDGDKGNVLGNKDYVGGNEGHTVGSDPFNLPEGAVEKPLPKDCKTPWGDTVKHNESILAYQQRSDVPDICNVQRRTCNDGVLNGSFNQPSCNENVIYTSSKSANITSEGSSNVVSYTRKTVVSHNDVPKGDLIQTPKYAKNEGAEYDTKGKLKNGEKEPITDWDNNNKIGSIGDYNSEEQINIKYRNCQAPRGDVVNHGQFVRAYELPFGFTNASCSVELRLCVDGELMGSYEYNECEYLDITYEEYNEREISREDSRLTTWVKTIFK